VAWDAVEAGEASAIPARTPGSG